MNNGRNTRLSNLSRILISSLAILFVLSLSLHSHAFYFDDHLGEKLYQTESAYPNHSTEFCSACRLSGDIKPRDFVNPIDSSSFRILIYCLNLDVLTPSSFLSSNKSPRSPPII